jgi:hypothetical protein
MEGLGLTGVQEVFLTSYEDAKDPATIIGIREDDNEPLEAFPITRSRRLLGNKAAEPSNHGRTRRLFDPHPFIRNYYLGR